MNTSQDTHAATPSDWQPIVSGNAELKLTTVLSGSAPALRLDFDFKGAAGFVVARRQLKRPMPKEYAVRFRLRGRGAVNDLELKLVDASGHNVWRHVARRLHLPSRWKRMKVESRDIDFAWGPSSGSAIAQLGAVEFAIVAGEGGKGTMWLADLEIEDCSPKAPLRVSASSETPGFEAPLALGTTGWKPLPEDPRPWLTLDSVQPRSYGGLVIDWLNGAPAAGFRVRASNTGRRWKTLHIARRAAGPRSNVYLPGLKTRLLRLDLGEPSAGAAVRLQDFDYSRSINAFWYNVADAEARGWHPRWLHREQSTWTPIGTPNGTQCALMNDDGIVEITQGSCSLEPMLMVDGRLFTWADVALRQELKDGWLPVPSVTWETDEWVLHIRAESTVNRNLRLSYRIQNRAGRALSIRAFALVRPFQVTPPWQSFRNLGGVSRITDLVWRENSVFVNETIRIVPTLTSAQFGSLCFDDGFIASYLLAGGLPGHKEAHDAFGFATGALQFDLPLAADAGGECVMNCMPAAAAIPVEDPVFDWNSTLPKSQWSGNGWIKEVIQAALTCTAHVLVTRSGPALQPGPRRYTRSWIRDSTMMSAALLRMRHLNEVREFIQWYAPHQRADGFVPCCVDAEGIDWLVEHDSHGQLIALIADYHRFSSDFAFLDECWSFVEKAVECIEGLLGEDGILPVSVSHEGYLAQPVHSFWDDFWALRGLRDAAALARATGREEVAPRWSALADRLAASLFAAIENTRARRRLEFIPGSVEWADFDPTATANALYLFDVPDGLNREAVERTFALYLADWRAKRAGAVTALNYTPYEIRIIGALVRLGNREAALELLQFFLSDRRPPPWNQWPEIAWPDHKAPAHLGDLPHTWISAEYVLAVRCLFAYEREIDASLILAAGLAHEWVDGSGVEVRGMPTVYGILGYSLRRIDAKTLRFEIGGGLNAKLVLRPPLASPLCGVTVNGAVYSEFDAQSVTLMQTPAEVTCSLA